MRALLLVVWLMLLLGVRPCAAQHGEWQPSAATGEMAFLSFNTLTGALTAGVAAKLRGKSFAEAAVQGAVGGAVVYGGKRLAVTDLPAAGLAGRQVATIGTSVVRNASEGRDPWERLIVPLVLARLHLNLPERRIEGVRVNMTELAWLGYLASREELTLDWGASLSSGAPVFDAIAQAIRVKGKNVCGLAINAMILMSGVSGCAYDEILKHERVHVLQHDFLAEAWGAPAESWLLGRWPFRARLPRSIELGVLTGVGPILLPQALWNVVAAPLEAEAGFLGGR